MINGRFGLWMILIIRRGWNERYLLLARRWRPGAARTRTCRFFNISTDFFSIRKHGKDDGAVAVADISFRALS
jgi:hypothetical protein